MVYPNGERRRWATMLCSDKHLPGICISCTLAQMDRIDRDYRSELNTREHYGNSLFLLEQKNSRRSKLMKKSSQPRLSTTRRVRGFDSEQILMALITNLFWAQKWGKGNETTNLHAINIVQFVRPKRINEIAAGSWLMTVCIIDLLVWEVGAHVNLEVWLLLFFFLFPLCLVPSLFVVICSNCRDDYTGFMFIRTFWNFSLLDR